MRKDEINMDVEYCETAPLAYGREPSVRPSKIMFIDLTPHTWLRTWEVVEIKEPRREGLPQSWSIKEVGQATISSVKQAQIHAVTTEIDRYRYPRTNNLAVGDKFVSYDSQLKGYLAVKRWHHDKWNVGLCQPAAVHRTWSAWEAENGERKAARHAAQVKRAPQVLRQSVADAMEAAALLVIGYDGAQPINVVIDELKRYTDAEINHVP